MSQPATSPLSRLPRAVAASASLESAPFGVLWIDHDGGVGYANQHVESLLGWPVDELVGQEISQLATFWSVTEWQETVWKKAGENQLAPIEGSWRCQDGNSCLLSAQLNRLQVSGQDMLAIYLHPTGKSSAASAPSAGQSGYTEFLDHVPAGVCMVDVELKILQINPKLCNIAGTDASSAIGLDLAEMLAPADEETESLWHQLPSLGLQDWNLKYRDPGGHVYHLVIASQAEQSTSDGEPQFLVTVEDISERVQLKRLLDQHEHSFEHLARNTPGMIYKFVMTPDGHASFPYASPGSYDIWEIAPEEVRDDATPIVNLIHPDNLAEFQNSVMKSASELSPWEYEGLIVTPSGKEKWIHAASRPQLEESGNIVWQGLLMDITHQKAIEDELKYAKLKAESAARSKADFLANMSHEIRTPMNGVIGMSELLANTELAPRQEHYVDTIRSSAEVLLTIINDILDISKMEAGKLLIHEALFDMRRMLDDVATLLAPRAFDKGIELIVRYARGVPQRVSGDAVRLRQILTNLIGNAIKFTAEGHVLVQVIESDREGEKATIKFSVTDTGIGISPEAMTRLFQKFEQEDSSTSRKFGGTGLGLAISQQLVELMDGELEVKSTLEQGSTFYFSLSMEVADDDIDDEVQYFDFTDLRILGVDDHPVNREVLADLLEDWGAQHEEVESGEAALQALRRGVEEKQPFDVALLDFQMPGMDGVFLASAIRAEPEINDVILLMLSSASFQDDQQRELGQAGVMGQLLKPLRQFELREALGNALAARGKEGEAPDPDANPALEAKSTPAFVTPEQPSSLRVLLAEDNEVNIEIALEMLRNLGLNVDCAEDGEVALAKQKEEPYDIIFMDCQMPNMDGFEATRAIRKMETDPPAIIIAMTAHAMAGDRDRCLECGMDDYLAKPVTFLELNRVIQKYLRVIEHRLSAGEASEHGGPLLFDRETALAVTGGSEEVLRRAVAIWWRKVPEWLTDLKSGFQRGDVDQIRNIAHTIRGASANIGAIAANKTAEHLEAKITAENLDEMSSTFDCLVLDLERLRNVASEESI